MISLLTDPDVGGHFVAWSIRYLSGQKSYYYFADQQELALTEHPLTEKNSHRHKENVTQDRDTMQQWLSQDVPGLHVFYNTFFNNATTDTVSTIDTKLMLEKIASHAQNIVLVDNPQENVLFYCKYKKRALGKFQNEDAYYQHFIDTYYANSEQQWPSITTDNIWDKRELYALVFRPFEQQKIKDFYTVVQPHFLLSTTDLWTSFDRTVLDLMDYLELTVDKAGYENWINVYKHWQSLLHDRLRFCWYFDEIINAILENRYIDLQRFELDIMRESAILHRLIHKHNLNLKSWQLEKFSNTQQLHNLLEPNIHSV